MLRAFAWLVSNVVSTLATIFNRPTRDWHTDAAEEGLLPKSSDTCAPTPILRDDRFAIPQDEADGRSTERRSNTKHKAIQALILRDQCGALIVSKDGGVLTGLSPLMPTNVGIQGRRRTLFRPAASSLHKQHNRSWIPTFVGISGYYRGQLQASA